MHIRQALIGALFAACLALAPPVQAQDTPADTARVLVDIARVLETEQEWDTLEDLLRFVVRHYPGTPAAEEAERWLAELRGVLTATQGRTRFIVFQTLYGAWLGVAIPAAFGAEDPTPFGVGLLLGGPAGFAWSSVYSRRNPMSRAQANIINFAEIWGTWQGIGWQQVLEIGQDEFCDEFGCFTSDSDTAPFAAAVVGGLVGLGTGLVVTRLADIPEGHSEVVSDASLWGSWYGVSLGVLAGAEDDALLTWTLMGGNVGLLGSIPLARAWNPSPGRVRLMTVLGFAGGLAGLGLDLIAEVDDEKTAILLPMLGTTAGLAAGFALTGPKRTERTEASAGRRYGALLNWDDGLALDVPMPQPATVPVLTRTGEVRSRPAARFSLLSARF